MRKTLIVTMAAIAMLLGTTVQAHAAETTKNVVVYNVDGVVIVAEAVPLSLVASVQTKATAEFAAAERPAPDLPPGTGKATVHCGWVTCSIYLTMRQTAKLQNNVEVLGGGVGALAASCGLIALFTGPAAIVTAVGCGAFVSVYGGFMLKALRQADESGGCLRIRYPVYAFYSDHSGYCHV